jgi:hypothetical protein
VRRFQTNEQGNVVLAVGASRLLLYRNSQLESLLREGDFGSPAVLLGDVSINQSNRVAFQASVPPQTDGYLIASIISPGTRPTVVWRGAFAEFESRANDRVAVNDSGTILFQATNGTIRGIFHGMDLDRDKAIGTGDTIFGARVVGVALSPVSGGRVLNNRGQFVFAYQLSNGETGIALATPNR